MKPVKVEFIVGFDRIWEDQEGLHIAGVLSIPRASLNGWIYLPEELALQDSKSVPMFFEHEEIFDPNALPIGRMNVFWNPDLLQLNYEAIVTDNQKIQLIKSGDYKHVSMGATWEDFDLIRGWLFPKGTEIIEGSLVKFPGIPEASVNIIDHVRPLSSRPLADSVSYLIPTKSCDMEFCNAILKDSHSHKAGEIKLPACDKKMSEENKEKPKNDETTAANQFAINLDSTDTSTDLNTDKETPTARDGKGAPNQDKGDDQNKRKLVVLDANGMKLLLKENSKMVLDGLKDAISPLQKVINAIPKPQPTALVSDGAVSNDVVKNKFYGAMTKALKRLPDTDKNKLDWDFIYAELKKDGIATDAVTTAGLGAALGKMWLEDITVIPAGLAAGIRNTCEVVIIERGAEEAVFTLIDSPDPVDGTEATDATDVTHTISTVTAKPTEKLIPQTVSDQAIRKTPTNLAESLAMAYRERELLDEDEVVLTELNGLTVANLAGSFFGGNATAENQIDSGDTFSSDLLAKAKRAIGRMGWRRAYVPGALKCVMSPEQHEQLITDTSISRFVETTQEGRQLREGLVERVHGVDILVSSAIPTGTGAGTPPVTTHRAFVYLEQTAVGLAFTKDLAIETVRDIRKRATNIVASWERAAKAKTTTAIARIVTYGSG